MSSGVVAAPPLCADCSECLSIVPSSVTQCACGHGLHRHPSYRPPAAAPASSAPLPSAPFRFLCIPTGSASAVSCRGEPATVPAWRAELLQHQPHVGEAADSRVLYAWERNETLETDEQVEGFVAFYQSHLTFRTPEVALLTREDIRKRSSPSLKAASSQSSSKSNSPPRTRLPPASSAVGTAAAASSSLHRSFHSLPGPASDISATSAASAPSAVSSTSTLDWRDPRTTLDVWLQRKRTLEERRQLAIDVLLQDVSMIPDLVNIVREFMEQDRYQGRHIESVARLLAFLQGDRTFFLDQ